MSILLAQRSKENICRFVNALKYFGIGCSWGGFESLVVPSLMPAERLGINATDPVWLVRLHIGLESAEDLWGDLLGALDEVR